VHTGNSSLACSRDRSGELAAWVGVPLADAYLKFLGGRCRPAIVRAAAWASADVAARAKGRTARCRRGFRHCFRQLLGRQPVGVGCGPVGAERALMIVPRCLLATSAAGGGAGEQGPAGVGRFRPWGVMNSQGWVAVIYVLRQAREHGRVTSRPGSVIPMNAGGRNG
jgi:hypothetical protein